MFCMNNNLRPRETRAVGWYALRWAHITNWYSSHRRRQAKHSGNTDAKRQREEFVEEKVDSPSVRSYTKHAIEDLDRPAIENIEQKRLEDAVQESNSVLVRANTIFPFTLFPTTVAIDRHKLTLIYRQFFKVEQTVSVPIENIKNIQANLGPFFGSIIITSDHFINNTQEVHFLTRKDAKKIQKLCQGAMVAVGEEIDVSKVKVGKLRELLEDLGGTHAIH